MHETKILFCRDGSTKSFLPAQCTSTCGEGVQYRSIFCDRSPPNTDRCDIRLTPDTTRQCTATDKCDIGDWFVGSWNQCSGDCFNLTQSRTIHCIKNGYDWLHTDHFQILSNALIPITCRSRSFIDFRNIVDDVNCVSDLKPIGVQKCNISQVSECGPSWHYSEWSEVSVSCSFWLLRAFIHNFYYLQCSRACGTGLQKRTVKCLSYEPNDGEMKESDNCKHKRRKRAAQACNVHSCETTTEQPTSDPRVDLIQNDIATGKEKVSSLNYDRHYC